MEDLRGTYMDMRIYVSFELEAVMHPSSREMLQLWHHSLIILERYCSRGQTNSDTIERAPSTNG